MRDRIAASSRFPARPLRAAAGGASRSAAATGSARARPTAVPVLAALACVAQGSRRKERLAWWCVGLAILAWGLGDIYYTFVLESRSVIPFPSLADAGYLAFYPPAYVALGLLVRSQVRGFVRSLWLDGLIAALTVAALAASVVFQVVLNSLGGRPGLSTAVATNLAYPLADILLLAIVAGMISLGG